MVGGGGSPVNPLIVSSTELHGMDGVVTNESLLELAASGQYHCQVYCCCDSFFRLTVVVVLLNKCPTISKSFIL